MSTLVVATQSRAAQTGQILVPDFVTAVVQLMTGIGLLGVAAMVRAALIFSGTFFRFSPLFASSCNECFRLSACWLSLSSPLCSSDSGTPPLP